MDRLLDSPPEGVHVRRIEASKPKSEEDDQKFFYAVGRFEHLVGRAHPKVTAVDVWSNSALEARFEAKRAKMQNKEVTWVFHGTQASNIPEICLHGFKVGGKDVPIVNGAVYGTGVYTSEQPDTAMSYARSGNAVVLSKALAGKNGVTGKDGADSWPGQQAPGVRIFATPEQLLPVYVIHY